MLYRPLANTGLQISEIALGCWPIAGMTSPGTSDAESIATIAGVLRVGHQPSRHGLHVRPSRRERTADRPALGRRRDEMVIATKCGLHWDPEGQQAHDARPATLRRQCEESLRRLETDRVELLYLHAPDQNVPVAESAGELRRLMEEGKTRAVGASNLTVPQLEEFAAECPLAAFQPPYNMLLRHIEADTLPWCREHGVAVLVYWPLMKGLLAGKIAPRSGVRSRRQPPQISDVPGRGAAKEPRPGRSAARRSPGSAGHSVAELVINWTIHQPGITAALCGAKRPEQIRECAGGSGWRLTAEQLAAIERIIRDLGPADGFGCRCNDMSKATDCDAGTTPPPPPRANWRAAFRSWRPRCLLEAPAGCSARRRSSPTGPPKFAGRCKPSGGRCLPRWCCCRWCGAPRWRPACVPLTVAFTAMNITYLSALALTTAANAIWLQSTAPWWVFLIGVLLLREPVDRRNLIPLVFGFVGVSTILLFEVQGQAWPA